LLGHGNPNSDISSVTAPFVGVRRSFRLPIVHVLFYHSPVPMKISLIRKPCLENKFLFLLPMLQTEITFLCCSQKVYESQKFCVGPCSSPLHWALKHSTLTECLPCRCARAALPHLQETTHLERTDVSFPSHSISFQTF